MGSSSVLSSMYLSKKDAATCERLSVFIILKPSANSRLGIIFPVNRPSP